MIPVTSAYGACTSPTGRSAHPGPSELGTSAGTLLTALPFRASCFLKVETIRKETRKSMTSQLIRSPRFAIALIAALLCFAAVARAGPPLICHAIEIGNAKSLPWTSHNWNLSGGETYDTKNLVRDTLDILGPNIPVLVRMETLRRATLYAGKDPVAAKELLAKLHARATAAESSGHPDALAWFDVGYLAEAYKQWIGQTWMRVSKDEQNPAAGGGGVPPGEKGVGRPGLHPTREILARVRTPSVPAG